MTIRRRLTISNFLMLIIPTLSLLAVSAVMTVFVWTAFDTGSVQVQTQRFDASLSMVREHIKNWSKSPSEEEMQKDLTDRKWRYIGNNTSVSVYKNKLPLYTSRSFLTDPTVDSALAQEGEVYLVVGSIALYKESMGEYDVVLTDSDYNPNIERRTLAEAEGQIFLMGNRKYVTAILIGVILLTNILLTRNVYSNIITPIDTLVYGVGQIKSGNLEYRIRYDGKDEFREICQSFNEMSAQLQRMVTERQREDENRRELIAGISHDLRTPLTAIKAYVEGLTEGVAKTPQAKEKYLNTITAKTTDLEHIVNQLFLFSKLDIGEYPFQIVPIDLNAELRQFTDEVKHEYREKGLDISFTPCEDKAAVLADKIQLRNILTNVLENSVKYGAQTDGKMEIVCSVMGGYALAALTDNGPGVSDDVLSRMFNLFYRGDRARSKPGSGSGLGLSISAKIMERFKGRIFADNGENGGFKITLLFPLSTIDSRRQ